ncbi:MAG TPA: protein kinase [Actinomycetota bacterium]|nr:protein kinase [Actinomycetota bacterium]
MKIEREGRRLGDRYVLESLIAAGGMAEVWRGRDDILGRRVAIKVLHDQLAKDPDVLERFRAEAVAAARLSHPGVVRVFDTGLDGETCYIVMELVEGPTLAESLARQGPLDPAETVRIARGILDALSHAHAAGVVHRDVKPTNVLTDDHAVKVTDFGIAKAAFARGDLTATGKLLGTAKYLAPEQAAGSGVDGRADLYALGIVMYEMLTGRVPFDAETDLATAMLRLTEVPDPPRALRAGIPRDLEKIVVRALSRDPDERFQSAEEMSTALERVAPAPERRVQPEPVHRPPSVFRSWMLIPLILGVLTAGAVVAGLALGRLEVGGPFLVRIPGQAATEQAAPISILDAFDFDPEGDGGERPELVTLAHDDDPATFWKTETYNSADLGGIKDGVGLVFDLGEPTRVRELTVTTSLPGWEFQVKGSNDPSSFSQTVPSVEGDTTFTASPDTPVSFIPVEFRYFLVWITELAEVDGGYQATIVEAQFSGG